MEEKEYCARPKRTVLDLGVGLRGANIPRLSSDGSMPMASAEARARHERELAFIKKSLKG